MSVKTLFSFLVMVFVVGLIFAGLASASVIRDGKKVYIEDHTGERWDVTQAKSLDLGLKDFSMGLVETRLLPLMILLWQMTRLQRFTIHG